MTDNLYEPDLVSAAAPAPRHGLTAPDWQAIDKRIAQKRKTADDQMLEVVGGVLGETRGEIDKEIGTMQAEIADLRLERQRLVLSVREARLDAEEEMRDLRNEFAAMQTEFTLLHAALSPQHTLKVSDAIKTIRTTR